jgi:hypothetical protein
MNHPSAMKPKQPMAGQSHSPHRIRHKIVLAGTLIRRFLMAIPRIGVRVGCVGLLSFLGCRTTPPPMGDTSELEVQAFVRQVYIHGVPYHAARRFDARVTPVLWRMLADPMEESHWPNIAVLLAIVGDEQVAEELTQYIQADHEGVLSPAHYAAKTGALMALGYNANHTGDQACLGYLTRCTNPAYWRTLDLNWRAPFPQSPAERNAQLATLAVIGLALSGAPAAENHLESLRQLSILPEGTEIQATVGPVLDEAIKACQTIQREGLSEYCRPRPQ